MIDRIYIHISIETYLGVIVRLFYSLFGVRWPLAKVFPELQTIRKDFLRPVCTLLGTFLGLPGFLFALVFIPVAQVSPHDNFRQLYVCVCNIRQDKFIGMKIKAVNKYLSLRRTQKNVYVLVMYLCKTSRLLN